MACGITAVRTYDKNLIKGVMFSLWDVAAEDCMTVNEFEPDVKDDCWVEMIAGDQCVGVYHLHALNSCTLKIHAQMLPEFRKEYSLDSGRAILQWIAENADENYQKVVAEVPTIYQNVIKFVIANGFQLEGINRFSYRKSGIIYDQCLMGITRPEIEEFLNGYAVKSVFGGSDDSAQKAQEDANYRTQKFIEKQSKMAREDALSLFPDAEKDVLAGSQAALDVLAGVSPQQMQALQAGGDAARAAILGTGQGQLALTPDMSFAQQILPTLRAPEDRFGSAANVLGGTVQGGLQGKGPQYLQGLTSNFDVLEAARKGDIPDLTDSERDWFGAFINDPRNADFLKINSLLDTPEQLRGTIVGVEGGLDSENERKMANLIDRIVKPRAPETVSRFLGGSL